MAPAPIMALRCKLNSITIKKANLNHSLFLFLRGWYVINFYTFGKPNYQIEVKRSHIKIKKKDKRT